MKFAYRYNTRNMIRPHCFLIKKQAGYSAYGWTCLIRSDIEKVEAWCRENLRGKHPERPRAMNWRLNTMRLRFEISHDDDAFAFRMRWC